MTKVPNNMANNKVKGQLSEEEYKKILQKANEELDRLLEANKDVLKRLKECE